MDGIDLTQLKDVDVEKLMKDLNEPPLPAEWLIHAVEAFHISLTRTPATPNNSTPQSIADFHPALTHAFFESDDIEGYQGLRIELRFDAADMRPNVQIRCKRVHEKRGDPDFGEIKAVLRDQLPDVAFQTDKDFTAATRGVAETFRPPGRCIATFEDPLGEGPYEIWKGTLADPAMRQLAKRFQILSLFFIDGASTFVPDDSNDGVVDAQHQQQQQDEELERWSVYLLYQRKSIDAEKEVSRYTFVGYCTAYRFLTLSQEMFDDAARQAQSYSIPTDPQSTFEKWPCRMRISQFLVLPPYLGQDNGGRLYRTVFQDLYQQQNCMEITVEDPSEDFDLMRDRNDIQFLRSMPDFEGLTLNMDFAPAVDQDKDKFELIDAKVVESLRKKSKLEKRQLLRLIEMHLLSKIPESVRASEQNPAAKEISTQGKRQYELWKQMVKARLYRHNLESLLQEDDPEARRKLLNDTLDSVQFEYARLLGIFEKDSKALASKESNLEELARNGEARQDSENSKSSRKRTAAEAEEVLDSAEKEVPALKKARKSKSKRISQA